MLVGAELDRVFEASLARHTCDVAVANVADPITERAFSSGKRPALALGPCEADGDALEGGCFGAGAPATWPYALYDKDGHGRRYRDVSLASLVQGPRPLPRVHANEEPDDGEFEAAADLAGAYEGE